VSTGEPDATESGHVRFGGRSSEKDQLSWHLVGGPTLPHGGFGRGLPGKRTIFGTSPGSLPLPSKPAAHAQAYGVARREIRVIWRNCVIA
jgi:hypothetical protein